MTDVIDYDAEPEATPTAEADTLKRIAELAAEQLALEAEVEAATAALKKLTDRLNEVSGKLIPDLVNGTGLSELRLADGTKVVVKEDLTVSTTGKWRAAINAWLEERGDGDLIKDEVVVDCGKDRAPEVTKLLEFAEQFGFRTKRTRAVNAASFKAHLKALLAEGADVPLDQLGAYVFWKTKLEAPR